MSNLTLDYELVKPDNYFNNHAFIYPRLYLRYIYKHRYIFYFLYVSIGFILSYFYNTLIITKNFLIINLNKILFIISF